MTQTFQIAIIGAGPAGLAAAERLAPHAQVTLFDRMPAPGRKLLMAGRGGLNLTHSEELAPFLKHYGRAATRLKPAIAAFTPGDLRAWCEGLGQETFVGSSGRVFPKAMKASPLLRAWLARLGEMGVTLRTRETWQGWDADGALLFDSPEGPHTLRPDATVLALGGASWPRLGSDGAWAPLLEAQMTPFVPSNMGFTVAWSDVLRKKYAGTPLKRIAVTFQGETLRGEAVITEAGIEGGVIYALSGPIRDRIAASGSASILIDLRPDLDQAAIDARLPSGRSGMSMANLLRTRAGLSPVAIALVQEVMHDRERIGQLPPLGVLIKALKIRLDAPFPLARAISSAGGIKLNTVDDRWMLRARPGVFVCGEMLDWEAPTGGYLLQACLSTGRAAAEGLLDWAKLA